MKHWIGLALLVLVSACGGGSGSPSPTPPPPPPPPAFTLTPTTVTANFTTGSPSPLTVTLKPSQAPSGSVYFAIGNTGGVLESGSTVSANSDGSYSLTIRPLSTLAVGNYSGSFTVTACSDQACKSPLSGSPVSVPFNFQVTAVPAPVVLAPATLTGTFVAGDAFPFALALKATPNAGVASPLYFATTDPSGTILPAVAATQSGSDYLLTLVAKASLATGHHTGTIDLAICSDAACTTQLGGSPIVVPFDLTVGPVAANSGLVPLTGWPGVPGWEMFQANAAHTGLVAATLDPSKFATRWVWNTPNAANDAATISTVVAENGVVYVNSGRVTYALREADKSVLWSYDFSAIITLPGAGVPAAVNPPAVSGGRVYVATSGQNGTYMFGFDAASGGLLFQTPFSSQWENYLAPTIDRGVVFEDGGYYGGMNTFDAASGGALYFTQLQQFDEWTPAVDANYAYAYIGGQTAYTPAQLNVIDRNSGTVLKSILDSSYQWSGYSMFGSAVIGAPGSVAAINVGNPMTNALIDFNTTAGTIGWSIPGQYRGNPAYAAGVFYALNAAPVRLEARAEADGSLLWSWSPPTGSLSWIHNDVLLTSNLAFVSTDAAIYAVDLATHQTAWTVPHPGRMALSETGVLYIVLTDANGRSTGSVGAVNLK